MALATRRSAKSASSLRRVLRDTSDQGNGADGTKWCKILELGGSSRTIAVLEGRGESFYAALFTPRGKCVQVFGPYPCSPSPARIPLQWEGPAKSEKAARRKVEAKAREKGWKVLEARGAVFP